jgi:hypothetical protein
MPDRDEWIPARSALSFLSRRMNVLAATKAICKHAHVGLVKARAVRFIRDGVSRNHFDVPCEMWWAEGAAALEQDWDTGHFETWIKGSIQLQAYGVTFQRSEIEKLLPPPILEQESAPSSKAKGGRPKAEWSDGLWIEICRQLYIGDLQPKKQADVLKAMMNWLASHGHTPAESTVKERARKLWAAIETDEN